MTRTLAAFVLAAALLPACSFGARGVHAVTASGCSSSRVAPIADTAAALAGAGAFAYGLTQGPIEEPGSNRGAIMGGGFTGALVFATSAIAGYTWAADCWSAGAGETQHTARR